MCNYHAVRLFDLFDNCLRDGRVLSPARGAYEWLTVEWRKLGRPYTKPPSALHACVLSVDVLARSLDRMEGMSGTNGGKKKSRFVDKGRGLPLPNQLKE